MSFDPDPALSGQSGAGGTSSVAGKSSGSSGSENSAGSKATAGSGSEEGGTTSGGSRAEAGAAGAESGGTASEGGAAGSVSGGSGGEATAGSSGSSSGSGGSSAEAGNGGSGGSSAGSGGTAGQGGSGGSDGGPCTPGVLGAHTYAFCGVVDNAAAAYAKCASLGLGMVTIESKFENDYVQGKQGSTWLGGTDEGMEGEWRWVSTQVLFWKEKPVPGVYNDFIDGQPSNKDNQGNPENCLVLSKSGWNDVGCELGDFKATCESSGGPIVQPQQ